MLINSNQNIYVYIDQLMLLHRTHSLARRARLGGGGDSALLLLALKHDVQTLHCACVFVSTM